MTQTAITESLRRLPSTDQLLQDEFYYVSFDLIIEGEGVGAQKFIDFGRMEEKEGMGREGVGLELSICKAIIE